MTLQTMLVFFVTGIWVTTFYYGAIISGIYKQPLMTHFLRYGEERRTHPLLRFLVATGGWCMTCSAGLGAFDKISTISTLSGLSLSFTVLGVMSFCGAFLVNQRPELRESLPMWYAQLLHESTREERRLIAYAWIRLPRRLRWRLNGDQASFRVWVDLVRLTMIYGARSRDDPWKVWQ